MTDRVNKILKHEMFLFHLKENQQAEANRCFCRHNMEHFLDVARIGAIINAKEEYGVEDELIYTAALLHDLGKHEQYEKGIPHEVSGAQIAPLILKDCDFTQEEIYAIVEAIRLHRAKEALEQKNLTGILYRADKASRACFACEAASQCNWDDEKKNLKLII